MLTGGSNRRVGRIPQRTRMGGASTGSDKPESALHSQLRGGLRHWGSGRDLDGSGMFP